MKLEPRRPRIPFDFGGAVTQPFRSQDGRKFVMRLVLWMTILLTLLYLITMPFILPHYGQLLEHNWQSMQAVTNGGAPPDSTIMFDILAKFGPGYAFWMVGMWLIMVSGETAMHRKLLTGEESEKRPMRLGKQELRVLLMQICVWGLWLAAYTLGVILVFALGLLVGALSSVLAAIIIVISAVGVLIFMCWVPVRLAPAAALTIDQDKRHFWAAKNITKHRFCNLFVAYLAVGVLGYAVIYVVMAICVAIATGNPDFIMTISGFGAENPVVAFEAAGQRLKNPLMLIIAVAAMVLYLAVFCVWCLCLSGVATYAVKWWKAEDPSPNFD